MRTNNCVCMHGSIFYANIKTLPQLDCTFNKSIGIATIKKVLGAPVPLLEKVLGAPVPLLEKVLGASVPLLKKVLGAPVPLLEKVLGVSIPLLEKCSSTITDYMGSCMWVLYKLRFACMGTPPRKGFCMHMCSTITCILEKQRRFLGASLYYIYTGKGSWVLHALL